MVGLLNNYVEKKRRCTIAGITVHQLLPYGASIEGVKINTSLVLNDEFIDDEEMDVWLVWFNHLNVYVKDRFV